MMSGEPIDERPDPSVESSALINATRVVRERWWIVLICLVVGFNVALAFSNHAVKQYTATSTLLVRPSNLPAIIVPSQTQGTDSTTLAHIQSDDVALVTSGAVAQRAQKLLGTTTSVSDLQSEVTATTQATNDLVTIQVSDPGPARAARIANAFATAVTGYLTDAAQAQLVTGQAKLQSELRGLPATDPGRSALEEGLRQVIALEAVTNGGASVVETASTPTSPSSPSVKRDAVVGGVAGLIIGLLLVFLIDLFDRRIKTEEALERLYGLSALAAIPLRRRVRAGGRSSQAELEPYRILRDGLAHVSLKQDMKVIMVTSSVSAEGKTRVASGLARAIASAGKRVVLIESDVHHPGIRKEFGLPQGGAGLMNVLVQGGRADALTQRVANIPYLSILSSGPFTPNSSELLRLPATTELLKELAEAYDFVIIDGAPLLPVADAQVLLDNPMIDVILLVARPYLTTREQIRLTLAIIKRHPNKGVGLAINGVRDKEHGYYGYKGELDDLNTLLPATNGSGRGARMGSRLRRSAPDMPDDVYETAPRRTDAD